VLWFVAMPLSVLTVGLSTLVVNGVLLSRPAARPGPAAPDRHRN
jgi:uncharacterized membrane protein YvlD (DUF360 family)